MDELRCRERSRCYKLFQPRIGGQVEAFQGEGAKQEPIAGVSDEPYTCPSCATSLYEKCPSCGATRHALLPACEHCGAGKEP